ncbi:MAG: hypothetical protein AAGA48_15145 [Myxococcota bacterium]
MTRLMPLFLMGCQLFPWFEEEEPLPPIDNLPTGPLPTDQEFQGGFLIGQFCDVQSVFQVSCVTGCHSGAVPGGGLDLDTAPYEAIVNVPAANGRPLVAPGNPNGSWLYTKMVGPFGPNDGQIMPPNGALDAVFTNVIYDWINEGAPNDCVPGVPPDPGDPNVNPHPPGWAEPEAHGLAANLQTDGDCRSCHGADLLGGSGVSCDECHEPGWRTNCTYCHGGVDNVTGAPPEDIDNSPVSLAFAPHTTHVTGGVAYSHPAYGCSSCHAQRIDVLTPGHIFDDVTPGYGELDYTGGLSPVATYLGGTCANVYCHGSGRFDDGFVSVGDPMYCYSCHPDGLQSQLADWQQMSGRHAFHMTEAEAQCYECHPQTTDAEQAIVNGDYHVDGIKQVQPNGITYVGGTCTGVCHEHEHEQDTWQ